MKRWKKEEINTAKSVGRTMERANKLTKHMPKAERAQFWNYAKQQAQLGWCVVRSFRVYQTQWF